MLGKVREDFRVKCIPKENNSSTSVFDQPGKPSQKGHGILSQKATIREIEGHVQIIVVDFAP